MRGGILGRLVVPVLVACAVGLAGCGGKDEADTDLSGENEVPSNDSTATGTANAKLDDMTLTVSGSFTGLTSDLVDVSGSPAHVHNAPPGENGPIVFNLTVTPDSDGMGGTFSGTKVLTDAEKDAWEDGRFYVNIHTTQFSGGEIRGQLEP